MRLLVVVEDILDLSGGMELRNKSFCIDHRHFARSQNSTWLETALKSSYIAATTLQEWTSRWHGRASTKHVIAPVIGPSTIGTLFLTEGGVDNAVDRLLCEERLRGRTRHRRSRAEQITSRY